MAGSQKGESRGDKGKPACETSCEAHAHEAEQHS